MLEKILAHEIEINNIRTTTISGVDLIERIYQGSSLPQDKQFLSTDKCGLFKYLDLGELVQDPNSSYFSILELNKKIVGLSELKKDPKSDKNFWLMFISIDPKYQGRGYSHKLIDELFSFLEKNAESLTLSFYSDEGEKRIKRKIEEKSIKSLIRVIDSKGQFLN